VPPDIAALMSQSQGLTSDLHLEIESYYVFAKIILDDVARAIEYYFGPHRGLALDSHDGLAKRMVTSPTKNRHALYKAPWNAESNDAQ
jgi:hypothetical protein